MFALPRVPRGPPEGGSSGSLARRRLASRLAPVAERFNTLIMCDYVKHAQIAEIHASPGTPVTVATHLRIQGAPVTEVMHVGRWSKQDSIGGYLRGRQAGHARREFGGGNQRHGLHACAGRVSRGNSPNSFLSIGKYW